MKSVLVLTMVVCLCFGTATAQDMCSSRKLPVKSTPIVLYEPPAIPKQGGDTIEDATVIPGLPFPITGTTVGFINNYDESCPYSGSLSPDVVYSFTPENDILIDVDLCGSGYDTKTYVYDSNLNLIDCNDDFYYDDVCGYYVSKIEAAPLSGGNTHFIVIDGYGGDSGDYILLIEEYEPCIFAGCHEDAVAEGEPPLHDGYEDAYNGGCNSPEFGTPFQTIDWINVDPSNPFDGYAWLCGFTGTFVSSSGYDGNRDTDWFKVIAMTTGTMEMTVETEFESYIFKLTVDPCDLVTVDLSAIVDCDEPATLAFPVTAGEEVWLWVGPSTFGPPTLEWKYYMYVSNNAFDTVPAEGITWGGVKSLYR